MKLRRPPNNKFKALHLRLRVSSKSSKEKLRIDFIGLENKLASLEETHMPEVKCFKFIIRYKGHKEGGQLTQALRKKPFCVILLDGFDKACTEIHQNLLRVLDEGRMTDCYGSTDLKKAMMIMTSNVGTTHLMNSIPKKGSFANALKRVICRANEILHDLVEKIIVKETEKCKAEFSTRGALLKVTPEAKDYIVNQGLGVRAVKAWIEKHVDRVLKD
uniref:ATPase AAA-type core domain-containing protein n=1 Tax=Tanacetum cinerariifolium TaxID=118510 RepID=A0A6L2NCA3_TANCI|nr:hypothetical protein [Tanacetum cinerariifolium]